MKPNTFAAISHKGGTGRSVTLANVAYRLALKGLDVCCVDLDFTSPTLGSVLGMSRYETGVVEKGSQVEPRSIFDLLNRTNHAQTVRNMCDNALVNIWAESDELRNMQPTSSPRFVLLPGLKNMDTEVLDLARLIPLIEYLGGQFDVVFLDVRSGNSEVADLLASNECDPYINSWLLHFRWTRQHLAGVANFVSSFLYDTEGRFEQRILLVSTAFPPIGETDNALRADLAEYNASLETRLRELCTKLHKELLGRVPFEKLLLWKEAVITQGMVDRGVASSHTYDSLGAIADAILRRLQESEA